MGNKKVLGFTITGFLLLALSVGLVVALEFLSFIPSGTGSLYGNEINYGFKSALDYFLHVWQPSYFKHETTYIGMVFVCGAAVLCLVSIILALVKKKPLCILTGLFLCAATAFLPFIFILVVPMVQLGVVRTLTFLLLVGATGLDLLAIYFLYSPIAHLLKCSGKKKCCHEQKNNGLDEEQVKALVKEGLDNHVEEYHSEEPAPAPAPVKEEEPEPEPEEEPVEEEPVEEPAEEPAPAQELSGGLVITGKRKRASFETRLKNSEFDLRHKYYDLRDYITWYGLKNRVSIPGDTFSYKRERYVFITIIGSHIRVYLDLDPKDYADSTMPVEASEAKKYEDLPCMLKVRSGLSYRRAKKLVDDLMVKIGLPRPEGDEPKETQNKD